MLKPFFSLLSSRPVNIDEVWCAYSELNDFNGVATMGMLAPKKSCERILVG